MELKINHYPVKVLAMAVLSGGLGFGVHKLVSSLYKACVKPDSSQTEKIQKRQVERILFKADAFGVCARALTIFFVSPLIMNILDRRWPPGV